MLKFPMEKSESLLANEKNDEEMLLAQLPKVKIYEGFELWQYQGFWCPKRAITGVLTAQKHFQAEDSDIIISTFPKAGTTWLKALVFAIVNRCRYSFENTPLLTSSPHLLVPYLESDLYGLNNQSPNLERFLAPRIFATHVPCALLPPSVLNSSCRVVYICRNPLDQFISEWQFLPRIQNLEPSQLHLDEAFQRRCNGIQGFGPVWEHVLGYWKASLELPDKVLFLKYEDLKEDDALWIKRLASFLGCPFSEDDLNQGVVEEISKLCSFDAMKSSQATKTYTLGAMEVENSLFLRKGKVGDWKNHLTTSMSQRLMDVVEEKLAGSGLTFRTSLEETHKIE